MLDNFGQAEQRGLPFFINEWFRLFVLYATSSRWHVPIIYEAQEQPRSKSSTGFCFCLLAYRRRSKVLSLQDCTPSCLLRGDLLSSHFAPGIKSAHTQTYTHKVENIRPHTYITAHSSLINHRGKNCMVEIFVGTIVFLTNWILWGFTE